MIGAVFNQGGEHLRDGVVQPFEGATFDARLAVNAHAKFHFVIGEGEGRLARGGYGASAEGDADAVALVVEAASQGGKAGQVIAAPRRCAQQFFQQYGAGDATPPGGVEAVFHRDVVIGEDESDFRAHVMQQFGGGFKIENVAGVIFDQQQHALTAIYRLRASDDLIRRGRGENFARHRAVEHAVADKTAVHRLMPAAAAGNQRDLARKRRITAGNEDRIAVQAQFRMRGDEALQLFIQDRFHLVDELFHHFLPFIKAGFTKVNTLYPHCPLPHAPG